MLKVLFNELLTFDALQRYNIVKISCSRTGAIEIKTEKQEKHYIIGIYNIQ